MAPLSQNLRERLVRGIEGGNQHGAGEQDRPDVAVHRRRWRIWQRFMDPASFVFLDERLIGPAPHGHRKTPTFLAGLRSTGIITRARLLHDRRAVRRLYRAVPRAPSLPATPW